MVRRLMVLMVLIALPLAAAQQSEVSQWGITFSFDAE